MPGPTRYIAALAVALMLVGGCSAPAHKPDAAKPAAVKRDDTLYRALGAQAGIEKAVDAVLLEIHNDPHINLFFANTDMPDLRRLLVEQFCAATGGPCEYTGRSMEEAHSGLNLTNADFDAFVEDLKASMNELKVPQASQKKLIGMLAPMRPQIVGQ